MKARWAAQVEVVFKKDRLVRGSGPDIAFLSRDEG